MGGAVSSGENNDALIDNLIEADYIKQPEVERVFRAVDRAFYYTEGFQHTAYKDLAWKHGNLHLSAPCIYSQVMESLELKPGLSFLNLGSGTGYLCTLIGLLLGANGVNHGIEIHSDVIDFARERLHLFMQTSPAVDEYEFCIPQFTKGNCLSLASNSRRYQRVYCGAACPESYELYMKQLLEIGGILVMPINDQLVQVRRLAENSWTVTNLLSVSFASLLMPGQDLVDDVVLPPLVPDSLQSLCRFRIRALLQRQVRSEHPQLWQRSRKHPKLKKRTPVFRRCVVPIFEESDDSDAQSLPDAADAAVAGEEEPEQPEEDDEQQPEPSPRGSPTVSSRRAATVRRPDSSESPEREGRAKTKREKFDSGVSDLCESSNEASPSQSTVAVAADSTVEDRESASSSSTTSLDLTNDRSSPMDSQMVPLSEGNGAIGNDNGEANPREYPGRRALRGIGLFPNSMTGDRDRAALVLFEGRLSSHESNDDDKDSDQDSSDSEEFDDSHVAPPENYTHHMREKLNELPLPVALKSFLDYDRSL